MPLTDVGGAAIAPPAKCFELPVRRVFRLCDQALRPKRESKSSEPSEPWGRRACSPPQNLLAHSVRSLRAPPKKLAQRSNQAVTQQIETTLSSKTLVCDSLARCCSLMFWKKVSATPATWMRACMAPKLSQSPTPLPYTSASSRSSGRRAGGDWPGDGKPCSGAKAHTLEHTRAGFVHLDL